jgi:hypothetical protein
LKFDGSSDYQIAPDVTIGLHNNCAAREFGAAAHAGKLTQGAAQRLT